MNSQWLMQSYSICRLNANTVLHSVIKDTVMCKFHWCLNLNKHILSVLNLLLTLSMWPFMLNVIFLHFLTFQYNLDDIVTVEVSQEKTTFIPPPCKENCSGCVDWKRTDWSWQKPGLSGCQRSLKLLKEKKPKTIKSITSTNALFWKSLWIHRQYW